VNAPQKCPRALAGWTSPLRAGAGHAMYEPCPDCHAVHLPTHPIVKLARAAMGKAPAASALGPAIDPSNPPQGVELRDSLLDTEPAPPLPPEVAIPVEHARAARGVRCHACMETIKAGGELGFAAFFCERGPHGEPRFFHAECPRTRSAAPHGYSNGADPGVVVSLEDRRRAHWQRQCLEAVADGNPLHIFAEPAPPERSAFTIQPSPECFACAAEEVARNPAADPQEDAGLAFAHGYAFALLNRDPCWCDRHLRAVEALSTMMGAPDPDPESSREPFDPLDRIDPDDPIPFRLNLDHPELAALRAELAGEREGGGK
jgi:hypothetical protein